MTPKNNPNPGANDATPFDAPSAPSSFLSQYLPDRERPAYPLSKITEQMGLTGPRIPAQDLVDKPFIILAAKTFGSSFDAERHAYFCIIRDVETDQILTTVLGGFAVTDILDAVVNSEFREPLLCTLRKHQGGRYGSYYVLE